MASLFVYSYEVTRNEVAIGSLSEGCLPMLKGIGEKLARNQRVRALKNRAKVPGVVSGNPRRSGIAAGGVLLTVLGALALRRRRNQARSR